MREREYWRADAAAYAKAWAFGRNPAYLDFEPVSYTHLDVYKRQWYQFANPSRPVS